MNRVSTPTHAVRRGAALVIAGLVVALLQLGVGASTSAGADPCLDETHEGGPLPLPETGCDDTSAPETALGAVTPAVNPLGYINSKDITFSFSGSYTDTDTGPISYQCKLDSPGSAGTWTSCTSPKTYPGLSDTTSTPYTFQVRAVDTLDAAISACDADGEVLDPACLDDEPLAPDNDDIDPTPASLAFKVDTVAPNTFLSRQPVDRIRPDWPVVLTASPVLAVDSNEPASFSCRVNGAAVTPCGPGTLQLRDLSPGDNTFVAQAVDRGGNLDPTPVTTRFFLPSNIKRNKGSGWKTFRKTGLFGGDYVQATKVGQVLKIKRIRKVREVRLIAAVGPKTGVIEVRIGTSQWYTVNLFAKKAKFAQVLVRDEYSPLRSGAIQIRVKSLNGKKSKIRLDALVARN
ncbi:hypothetical protein [Nocardioides dilutus]